MKDTNFYGLLLIVLFTANTIYVGSRLGLCWVMMEERYEKFRGQVRDPYPAMAEVSLGRFGKAGGVVASVCIACTLYGGACVQIVLIAEMLQKLFIQLSDVTGTDLCLSLCVWMVIVVAILTPITWLGTPNDFWPIAVGALVTTLIACTLTFTRIFIEDARCTAREPEFPSPDTFGFFKAFSSIMFAFSGASTFPTIQADMKDRNLFPRAATAALLILFVLYFGVAAAGYFILGDQAQQNIIDSLCETPYKTVVQISILLHLFSALPIIVNAPNQYFENILNIPKNFNIKRCLYRTFSFAVLLFISETIPNFGSILDLVGGSTVTMLTFIFPPIFYIRLCQMSKLNPKWKPREVSTVEMVYCIALITMGVAGGGAATYNAIKNIVSDFKVAPCYVSTDSCASSIT